MIFPSQITSSPPESCSAGEAEAVAFRYRSLVPFMYMLLILETFLRMLVGHMRPMSFVHTPPGAIANYVILPLAVLMLVMYFWM